MEVICISGKAQHGKDTTCDILKNCLEEAGKSVLVAHYADLVKFICTKYFGWNGLKDLPGRTILQQVGTDIVRKKEPHYWVDFVISVLKFFPDEWDYVIIPDTRFPDEIERMSTIFRTWHVRVFRPNFDNGLTEEQKQHPSETSLDRYPCDFFVINDNTVNDLRTQVQTQVANKLLQFKI